MRVYIYFGSMFLNMRFLRFLCSPERTKSVVHTARDWLLVDYDANYDAPNTKKVLYQILPWLGFQGNIKLFVSPDCGGTSRVCTPITHSNNNTCSLHNTDRSTEQLNVFLSNQYKLGQTDRHSWSSLELRNLYRELLCVAQTVSFCPTKINQNI